MGLMKLSLFLFFLFSSTALASSGFIRLRTYHLENQAQDIINSWSSEAANQFIGSYQGELSYQRAKFSYQGFLNYVDSPLYDKASSPANFLIFPSDLSQRDTFNLQLKNQNQRSAYLAGLNQFSIKYEFESSKLTAGRMLVKYGEGIIFNPINPFNSPNRLSHSPQLLQGNDGIKLRLTKDPKLTLNIYLLGDRTYTENHQENTKSLIIHGDWHLAEKYQLNYLLGEDQNRHFYAIEFKRKTENQLVFAQIVKAGQDLEEQNVEVESLTHYALGIEQQVLPSWKTRVELGEFQQTRLGAPLKTNFFLPFEKAVGWINTFKIKDKIQLELDLLQELKSEAQWYRIDLEYYKNQVLETSIFASGYLKSPPHKIQQLEQLSYPKFLGLSVGVNF